MATFAEHMRKLIDIIEKAVWNDKQDLRYCYIDISTATKVGETAIRIFPKEGRNKFFNDVSADVEAKLGDIDTIIHEAKSVEPIDRVRIIIAREYGNSVKQLTRYVTCDNDNSAIILSVMKEVKELAYLIKFHDVRENPELFSEIQDFYKIETDSSLHDLEKHLKSKYNKCVFSTDKTNLEIERDGINYLISGERWKSLIGENLSVKMA